MLRRKTQPLSADHYCHEFLKTLWRLLWNCDNITQLPRNNFTISIWEGGGVNSFQNLKINPIYGEMIFLIILFWTNANWTLTYNTEKNHLSMHYDRKKHKVGSRSEQQDGYLLCYSPPKQVRSRSADRLQLDLKPGIICLKSPFSRSGGYIRPCFGINIPITWHWYRRR